MIYRCKHGIEQSGIVSRSISENEIAVSGTYIECELCEEYRKGYEAALRENGLKSFDIPNSV